MPRLSKKTMFAIEAVLDVAFHVGAVGRRITRVRFTRTAGQLVVGDVHAAVEIVLHVRLPV